MTDLQWPEPFVGLFITQPATFPWDGFDSSFSFFGTSMDDCDGWNRELGTLGRLGILLYDYWYKDVCLLGR